MLYSIWTEFDKIPYVLPVGRFVTLTRLQRLGTEMVTKGRRLDGALVRLSAVTHSRADARRRMKYQIFIPLMLLQIVNLFWYFRIWRVLYRCADVNIQLLVSI